MRVHFRVSILVLLGTLFSLFSVNGQSFDHYDDEINPLGYPELVLEEATRFGHAHSEYKDFRLSPDGEYIAALVENDDDYLEVWHIETRTFIAMIEPLYPFFVFAWSPDSSQIATIIGEPELNIWDAMTGEMVETVVGVAIESRGARAVEWYQSDQIMTGGWQHQVRNLTDDTAQIVECHPWGGEGFVWSPNREYVATRAWDSALIWICNAQFERVVSVEGYRTMAWSPDNTEIATVGIFNTLRIWYLDSGAVFFALAGDNNILKIDWHSDGQRLVTGHIDDEMRIWSRETYSWIATRAQFIIPDLEDVAWRGDQIVTTSASEGIQIWGLVVDE